MMLSHYGFVLLLVHVCQSTSDCSDRPPSCIFTEEPQTQSVTLNTEAIFTCTIPPGFRPPFFLIDCIPLSDLSNLTKAERGIRPNPMIDNEASVTIQAVEVNNNSNITCVSEQNGTECHSNAAFLNIDDRPPSCIFTKEPQTQSVTLNTEANFTCTIPPGFRPPFFLIDCIPLSDLSNLTKAERGIRPNPMIDNEASVTIQALEVNNNSNITCVSEQNGTECHSNVAFLNIDAIADMRSVSGIRSTNIIPTTMTPTVTSIGNIIYTTFSATSTPTPVDDGGGGNDDDDDDNATVIIAGPVVGVCFAAIIAASIIVGIVLYCCHKRGKCPCKRNPPQPSNGLVPLEEQ